MVLVLHGHQGLSFAVTQYAELEGGFLHVDGTHHEQITKLQHSN